MQKNWKMDEATQQKVWVLLWRWWSARNKVNAREKRKSAQEICSLITFYVTEFEKLKKKEGGNIPKKLHKWKPPPPGYYKINIDASYQAKKKDHVDRDSLQEIAIGNFWKEDVETWSTSQALQRVAELGMTRIVLETDATNLEKGLNSDDLDWNAEGGLFRQIRDIMNHSFVQCVV